MKIVAGLAAMLLTVGVSTAAIAVPETPTGQSRTAPLDAGPLHILLSNDDGVGRGGLPQLQKALCEAGHDVTVSAPASNQSGGGGSMTGSGTLKVVAKGPACDDGRGATYAVHGTPADSVLFALTVLKADPDLVVTGINPGQNIADAMSLSGTIGAAMIAAKQKIPTISVSVENDAEDFRRNGNLQQTDAAMPDAAAYTTNLIRHIETRSSRGAGLPEGLFLNIAYPVVLDENGQHDASLVKGTRVTRVGDYAVLGGLGKFSLTGQEGNTSWYDVSTPGFCRVQFDCPAETVRNADSTALEGGFVSVTPLETGFGAEKQGAIVGLLGGFDG